MVRCSYGLARRQESGVGTRYLCVCIPLSSAVLRSPSRGLLLRSALFGMFGTTRPGCKPLVCPRQVGGGGGGAGGRNGGHRRLHRGRAGLLPHREAPQSLRRGAGDLELAEVIAIGRNFRPRSPRACRCYSPC